MYDIIIVGAGPAGLTAAIYARRALKKVLILEALTYGGQIINAHKVENYPGIESINGFDFANTLYEQVKKLGGLFLFETVVRIEDDNTLQDLILSIHHSSIHTLTQTNAFKIIENQDGKALIQQVLVH